MLILDEPTSGVDPLARDRFWELLIDLSRNQGVTIFVSTHFMNEAERCDRISLMDSGRVLATDTPAEPGQSARRRDARGRVHQPSRRGLGSARRRHDSGDHRRRPAGDQAPMRRGSGRRSVRSVFSPARSARSLELCAIRSGSALRLFGTTFLMLVFGFGISTDVNNLSFAVLDRDQSHESRAYLEEMRGSPYFRRKTRARRLCRSREAARKRGHQCRHRNPARLWPRYRTRAACVGRCLGRWCEAVRRPDDPRLSARACINCISPIRR